MVNNSIKGHQQFLINKGTFRVRFSKENQFVKVDRNVTQNAEKSIQDNSCLRLDRVNPTTEIWYIIRSEGMGFYCQLLFKRKVTEKNLNRGELRPEFSNLMCSCIILNKDMIICDPFCGYGAIPKQLITRFNVKKVYASDLDKEKVDLIKKSKWSGNKKIKVFHANAMNIKEIADSTVDAVITDPPWGYYEQIDDMKDFYKEMLKELNRIVKENGKIVILTAKKEEFESICIDLGISISEKYKVLMVDCDSQCNLTAYTLSDNEITKAWDEKRGNSIYRVIEKVEKGIGDISFRTPTKVNDSLYITPGDLLLSNYEDRLGDSWSSAKGGSESSIRLQTAIFRYVKWASKKIEADIV